MKAKIFAELILCALFLTASAYFSCASTESIDFGIVGTSSRLFPGGYMDVAYFIGSPAGFGGNAEIHFLIEKDGKVEVNRKEKIRIAPGMSATRRSVLKLPENLSLGRYLLRVNLVSNRQSAEAYRTIYLRPKPEEKGKEEEKASYSLFLTAVFAAAVLLIFLAAKTKKKWVKRLFLKLKSAFSVLIAQTKIIMASILLIASFAFLLYILCITGFININYVYHAFGSYLSKIFSQIRDCGTWLAGNWQYPALAILFAAASGLAVMIYKKRKSPAFKNMILKTLKQGCNAKRAKHKKPSR